MLINQHYLPLSMANLKILNTREKKNILSILKDQYGFDRKMDYVFFINKKNKIYIATPDIAKIDFDKLKVNSFGIYFGELYKESLRLSVEGSQLIGPYATKNVVELDESEIAEWVKGLDIPTTAQFNGFVVVKYKDDCFACGKTKEGKLLNYLPKARSLKVVND